MPTILVDSIEFDFPAQWEVVKFDEWRFYRNRFCAVPGNRKAMDLLACSPDKELFLIEAKDYRQHRRQKSSDLCDEIASKVVDTLAALLPAATIDDLPEERTFARAAVRCERIRIILHLEQAATGNRISPRRYDPANLQIKFRQKLKAIDRRCLITEIGRMQDLPWNCR